MFFFHAKIYCTSSFFQKYVQSFIELMNRYEVVPEEERMLFDRRLGDVVDYSKRRELKINQYKKEKELRGRIEVTISCWSFATR